MKKAFKTLIACGIFSQLTPIALLIYGAIRTVKGSAANASSLVGAIGAEAMGLALVLNTLLFGSLLYFACKEGIKAVKILAPIGIGLHLFALCILLFTPI